MPRIKWKTNAKISTLALGLKSDTERASVPLRVAAGDTIEVSAPMVKALEKIHGGLFTVLEKKTEKAPEEGPPRKKKGGKG